MAELASALFGRSRLETHVSDGSQTSTVYGKATSDSDGGKVNVVLGDAVTADGGTNAVELATTTSVKSGDNVIVTLVGGDAGKHPIVTGVVGRGDEQQAQIAEAMEKAEEGGTRVFMEQPTPPYNKGDLWAMAPTTAEGDYADAGAPTIAEHEQAGATYGSMEAYEGRTMLVCTHDRAKGESFDKGDWTVSLELNGHYATHSDLTRTESEIRSEVGDELKVLRGDVEAEAVARQSAIDQKADEITASVAESYATKDALNGEVTSRESIVRQTTNGVEIAKKVNGVYTGTKAVIDDDSFDIQGQDGTVYSSFGASKVKLGSWGPEAKVGDKSSIELFGGSITGTRGAARDDMSISTMGALRIQAYDTLILSSDIAGISLSARDGIKLGGGTMLKAVYCGSTVVYINSTGNAKLFSGNTYGTKDSGHSNLIVSSGDHSAFTRNITAWWANDGSGDWWVHADVVNKDIRVNWTLFVW